MREFALVVFVMFIANCAVTVVEFVYEFLRSRG